MISKRWGEASRKTNRARAFAPAAQTELLQSSLEIALPRSYVQVRTPDPHFDRVIVLRTVRFPRSKSDGVNVSSLFGDFRIETRQPIFPRGVKRVSSRSSSILVNLRHTVLNDGTPNWGLMSDGDSKNGNVGEKKRVQSFVERVLVVVSIVAVRNEENYFSAVAPASLQHLPRGVNGVVQRVVGRGFSKDPHLFAALPRSSSPIRLRLSVDNRTRSRGIVDNRGTMRRQIQALKRGKKSIVVEREIRDSLGKFCIGDQSHFVIRPKSAGDRVQTLLHLFGFLFREVVVEQDHRGKRKRLRVE